MDETYYTVVRKTNNGQWHPVSGPWRDEKNDKGEVVTTGESAGQSCFAAHVKDNPQYRYRLLKNTPEIVDSYTPVKLQD